MEMEVLKQSKNNFKFLGILPIDDQTNHLKQLSRVLFGWLAALLFATTFVLCLLEAVRTTDLIDILNVASSGVACLRLFVSHISMILLRQTFSVFFEKLQRFHDKSNLILKSIFINSEIDFFKIPVKFAEFRGFFENNNQLSNKVSKIVSIYCPMFVGIQLILMALISVLYCFLTRGYVQADFLFHPYRLA